MKTIEHFLSALGIKGIRLEQIGERLKVHAPKGAMTAELAGSIRDRKAEILAFLRVLAEEKSKVEETVENASPDLSFAQQRLWFIDQLTRQNDVSTGTYNIFSTTQLTGELDSAALQKAITQLEKRHAILRANFQEEGGQPVQTIHADPRIELSRDDLSMKTKAEVHATIVTLCDRGFSLADEPLLRLNLIRRGPQKHLLVLCMHHIISDGWSMAILVRELIALYAQAQGWNKQPLTPLPMQYGDFAAWQRSPEIAKKLEQQAAWWEKKLAHMPALHQIPTDRPRPPMQTQHGATFHLALDKETRQALAAFAKKSGATPFMICLAAFQLLLAKYSYQDDIAVGTPIANRNRRELEPLIGFFVNTLVLRTHVDQTQSFLALVDQVKHNTLAAHDHQGVPFEKIVDRIQPTRDNSHTPLFQIMFSLQTQQNAGFTTPGLSLLPIRVETHSAKFDLHLDMVQDEQGLVSDWQYNTDLFDSATIEAMAGTFHQLLRAALENPQQKLSHLAISPLAEPDDADADRYHEKPKYRLDHPVHVHFEKMAAQHPEHAALILGNSGELGGSDACVTYGALNQRANQWAWHLLSQGVKPEDRIALIAQSSAEMVTGLLAILKVSAIAVPLDASTPEPRLHQMLRDSGVKVALSHGHGPTALPNIPVLRLENPPLELSTENPRVPVSLDQVAYLIYTSGSTGTPKASMNTHRGMLNHHLWMQQVAPLGPQDRIVNKTTISFDAAMWECLLPLTVGAQLVLGKAGLEGNPFALRQALVEFDVTHTFFVPSVLRAVLDLQGDTPLPCKIRHVFCGGEKVQPLDHRRVLSLIDNPDGPVHFYNIYGPSECAITCIAHPCGPEPQPEFPPIGKPHGNMGAFVVDPHLTKVPTDMPGELVLTGPGLSRGYQNQAALTAVKFVPNPFEPDRPGSRLYRSGDLVRYKADHNLHFVSRIDHQIKLRGVRIELGEIEASLTAQPEINQAAVVVNQSDLGGQRLVGFLKFEGPADASLIADIKERLSSHLPAYMVPSVLVPLEQLPQLPSGKVARLELAKRPLNFDPSLTENAFREPETELEKTLATIWAEVLELDKVGLDDNFFEIGGHSLLATKVVSRIRDQQQLEFPLEKMFSLQTLAHQAQWLQGQQTGTALPPITAVPRDDQALDLSFAQQRLWFIDQLTRNQGIPSAAYNISSVLKMKGTLSTDALQKALTCLEMRHEVLRTQFEEKNGVPFQVVRSEPIFQLGIHDFSQSSPDKLRQWIDSSTQRGFALDTDPLLRMDLLLRDEDEFILVLTMHHIISDGWSMNILVQELIATYSEAIGLGPASLPDLDIQYADFAAWQRSDAVAVELDRQASWWETHLAGLPALHQLPTDRPRPPHQTQNGAALGFQFDPTTTANLEKLANAAGATLFMVVLTAFKIFLAKYSGQKDIVVGTPIANRNRSQVEPLIGFFVNTLVLRDEMDSHLSFRSLLGQIKANTLQSYAHQDVPFEKLVDLLQPERQTSYPPLFQIMFSMQNLPATRVSLADLQIESMEADTVAAKFDLTLDARETPAGLATDWRFNTDLFDHETIQRMMASFKRLIEQILSNPDQSMAQLSLTSQEEWDYQVHALNQTQAPLDYEKPMYAFVEEWAASHPQRLALTAWNGETWTYAELNRRANRIAWQLRELGIATDDRVAVFLQRSPEMIATLLGILKAGAAYVPIDPEYPEQRWAHMLEDSQAPLLLTTTALAPKLGEREHLCVDAMLINSAEETNLNLPFSPDQAFFLIYTSGSSGKPKASVNRHRGMVNYVLWHQSTFPLTADDRVGLKTPFGFDVASWETFWPLVAGASLAIAKPGTSGDPFYLREWLVDHQVTSVYFVPSMLRAFLDSFEEPPFLSPLRFLFTGGEALPTETQQAVLERMAGPQGPLEIHNVYGPSEASLRSAYFSCGKEPRRGIMPIGRSLSNTKAYVVDAHGRMQPLGVPGELQVAGVHTSRGYLGKPALTAERFIPNAFAKQLGDNRIYRTGDLVRRQPHGDLLYLGRVDAQVKLRGMRLELGEIEAQISALEEVDFARVLLNAPSGNQYLVAFIQTQREEKEAVFQRVREALAKELPSYMIPASMIAMDQWPVLPNGKIDGRKLQALAAESQASTAQRSYVAPRNDIEETLCGIWQEVLGLDQIGIHDSFFEIGGHSLLATQVVSRIRAELSVKLSLQQLFTLPTIHDLAGWIEHADTPAPLEAIPARDRDDAPMPLSYAQQRLWFIDQLTRQNGVSTGTYNIFSTTRVKGELDADALQQAISQLEMRHEILRTQFQELDGKPVQVLRPEAVINLSLHNFSELEEAEIKQTIIKLCARGFSLGDEPLMRLDLIRRSPQEHLLVLCMHHIISDGWSMDILVRELIALYTQSLGLEGPALPELSIQYADFTHWQRSPEITQELDRQAQWWQKRLAHLPPVHQVPTDRPRPQQQTQHGANVKWELGLEISEAVERFAQTSGATPFMLLLAAFQLLLAKYSGQDDIAVGTPVANRNRKELEPLIGFFVNTLVLRTRVDSNLSFQELLDRVRTDTLESYDNQDIPFEKMVELLQPARDPSYAPLFQIMFSIQNKSNALISMTDLVLENVPVETAAAKFDLHLDLAHSEKGLLAIWQYNTDLFQRDTVATMAQNFQQLLGAILKQPHQAISQIAFMDEKTGGSLMRELNHNPVNYGLDQAAHVHFERAAERHPTHAALILTAQETTLSYADLNRRANQWAWQLLEAGVTPEARIALIAQSSAELVIGLLAILKTGAIAVPLDANTPDQRLQQILADSGVSLALSQGGGPKTLPGIPVLRLEDEPVVSRTDNPQIPVDLDQVAYLIYTSGSTGTPKASMNTQRGLCNHHLWMQQFAPMGPHDRMINKTTISFDAAMWELLTPLMFGAQVVLGKPGMEGDPFALRKALASYDVTHIFFVPSVLRALLDQLGQETLQCRLRHVFVGGETVLPQDHERVLAQICHPDEVVNFYNIYGPSECAVTCVSHPCGAEAQPELPPIGKPHGNMRAYVVDPHMKLMPMGMPGELMLAGVGLSRGYLNRPGLTAAKFVPNPFDEAAPGSRLYRSGDLARIKTDHLLHFVSRMDYQIKLRGMRIELGDIETQLVAHAQVAQAAVVVNQSERGGQRLVGYFLPVTENYPDLVAELKAELAQKLPAYMVPSALIALESMPQLPNGKIARVELAQRTVHFGTENGTDTYREPKTHLQKSLVTIWQEVLQVERVGLDDNFFEIGGHSLLATQVVSRVRSELALEIPLSQIFTQPTIQGFAALIDKADAAKPLDVMMTRAQDDAPLPLSFAQQRLWFMDQLTRQSGVSLGTYNIYSTTRIKGELNAKALQQAIHQLEIRHQILRTQFQEIDGKPIQVLRPEPAITLSLHDLREQTTCKVQQTILGLCAYGFSLSDEPLMRLDLIRCGAHENLLVLCMHHIISDGWSMTILVRELITLYTQALGWSVPALPELSIQYADFTRWQRSPEFAQELDQQAQWWQKRLAHLPPVHQVPTDRPRPQQQTQAGANVKWQLDPALTQAAERLAQSVEATPFMVFLAAFQLLLAKYSGQEDIVVGTPIANRNRKELELLIGFFVNTLVLRTHVDDNLSFLQLLEQVRRDTLESYEHQDLPFEKLVDLLQPVRDTSYAPLFQIMFSLQAKSTASFSMPDLDLEPLRVETDTAKFDLHLDLVPYEKGLMALWQYNTDLFQQETIATMAENFQHLLQALLEQPECRLSQIAFMDETTQDALVGEVHQNAASYSLDQAVHIHFEQAAERHPDHPALILDALDTTMSYGELNRRANQWAWYLLASGVEPEARIALIAQSSAELVIGLLAILKTGAIAVPLDANTPDQRLHQMLADSGVSLALSQGTGPHELPGIPVFRLEDEPDESRTDNPQIPVDLDQVAFLIYTSGSTGTPKASMNTHRGLSNHHLWIQQIAPMAPRDRMIFKTTISFDLAMWELLMPLMFGAQVVLAKPGIGGDALALKEALAKHDITHIFFVSSVLRAVLNQLDETQLTCRLRHIFIGGETVLPQDQQRTLEHIVHPDETVRVYNGYGPSECAITCVSYACGSEARPEMPPIGRPHGNMRAYVVDARMALTPMGIPGELMLAGAGLSRGYMNRPGLTAAKFVPNPFDKDMPGSRLYRSGDLVCIKTDSMLHFVSRMDHQVKLRGMRIELGDIESQLTAHPQVAQAAVVIKPSKKGDPRLVGYYLPVAESHADLGEDLKKELTQNLPAYMVPAHLIALEAMPQLPNGKIARVALTQREIPSDSLNHAHIYREPETQLQKSLATIWQQVLEIEHVGLDDNFFEIGGHSLLATQVVSRVRTELGMEMPLQQLFAQPSLEALAAGLASNHKTQGLPAIGVSPRDGAPLQLSFAQQRLWFINQLTHQQGSATGTYNIFMALEVKGHLRIDALQTAVNLLEQRHEVLRTNFQEQQDKPVQVICDEPRVNIQLHDRSQADEQALFEEMAALCQQGFSLRDEPLLRLDILQHSAEKHFLVLNMHHIISDGWSMAILVQELIALYHQSSGAESNPLAPLAVQYGDFSTWQRSPEVIQELERQAAWWQEQLAHLPVVHQVPTDRPRPRLQTQNGASLTRSLDAETSAALENFAQASGGTLFMVLLAAFQLLLAKYSGQNDIAVGTPIANRNRREIEPLIGFFVNTLVMRAQVDPDASYANLLRQVIGNTLASYDHQDVPFEKVVDLLQPERHTSHAPLFQIMFSLQNAPGMAISLPELSLEAVKVETQSAKFDLHLNAFQTEKGLQTSWQYNTDLFNRETVATMAEHFQHLLGAILEAPEQPMSHISFMDEATRGALLQELNHNPVTYRLDQAVHCHFEQAAERHPNHEALILDAQAGTMSYGDLNRRANQWAWLMLEAGVTPEARVALIAQSSAELVIGLLAILKTGAIAVPLDANTPDQRLHQILADSGVSLALSQGYGPETLPGIPVFRLEDEPEESRTDNPEIPVDLDQVAYLIYTSGSTGTPKASMNTHRGLANHHLWMQQFAPMGPRDRMINKTTISFDAAMWELLTPLLFGAQVVLGEPGMEGNPFALRKALEKHQVSHVFFVPSVLRALLDQLAQETLDCRLRHVFVGGETVLPQDHERVLAHMSHPDETVNFYNIYGPSECAVTCVSHPCGPEAQPELPAIGKPHGNMRAYVVDPHMKLMPKGMPGELMLAGVGLSRGYLNRPGLTAAKFVPNPFDEAAPGSRLYRSGDLALVKTDHLLHFVSRMDYQIKLRGMRIELGDIETQLVAHPQVAQAAVVVNQSEKGGMRLVGYFLPVAENYPDLVAELKEELTQKLPAYMVPTALIALESMPQLPNGKIARVELAQREFHFEAQHHTFVPPSNQTEATLCEIWQDVLDLDQVGIEDPFFEIGGHSLLATQVISRIRNTFQVDLPLQRLFEAPTIRRLAAELAEATPLFEAPIDLIPRTETLPLSFAQARFWFLYRLEGPASTYNMPVAFRVTGPLDLVILEQAYSAVVGRHENLRTTFHPEADVPQLLIHPASAQSIPFIDLGNLPIDVRDNLEASLRETHGLATFSLETGPLHRLTCLRRGIADYTLLLNMHHIISDGWSLNLFMQEMMTLYRAFASNTPSPLPELAVQYADYASWQQGNLESVAWQKQLTYWETQLGGNLQPLALPTDYRRPAVRSFSGAQTGQVLDAATSKQLAALAGGADATLFMVLLSGFYHLLARHSGADDITIGTPIAGRRRSETEPLIGVFLNTLVLRAQLTGEQLTFRQLLEQVRGLTLDAYANQDIPFEKLLEVVNPERDLSRTPLFQVFFNMINLPPVKAKPLSDLTFEQLGTPEIGSKFDLTMYVATLDDERIAFQFHYNADLFEPERMRMLLDQYVILLQQVVQAPDQPLQNLSLVTKEARDLLPDPSKTLSRKWVGPVYQNLQHFAENQSQKLAVHSTTQTLTYRQLEEESNRLAHLLNRQGVAKGDPVVIYAARCPALVTAVMGVLKAGATITMLDPAYPVGRLEGYCEAIRPVAMLELASAGAAPLTLRAGRVFRLDAQGQSADLQHMPTTPLDMEIGPDDPALITFTSGSTGKPKGIVGRHGSLTHFTPWLAQKFAITGDERFSMLSALAHDPLQRDIFTALWVGATLCVPDPQTMGPDALFRWMADQQITVANLAPVMIRLLEEGRHKALLPEFRLAFTVGDALMSRDVELLQTFAPGITIVNLYGTTETQRALAFEPISAEPAALKRDILPLGTGMPGSQLLILTGARELAGIGEVGEIYIRSPHLALGYLDDPALTEEKFLVNPYKDGEPHSLYRTGDLGFFLPDGRVAFAGRADHQVQIRGFRIELSEIESVLRSHPNIEEVAVIRHQPKAGDAALVAYLKGDEDSSQELIDNTRSFLRERMPRFMIPSFFAVLDQLPVLPSGKLDRLGLSKKPLPRTGSLRTGDQPSTPTETELCQIWQEVLKLDQVGVHENFFDMGGNSLLAMQIHSRMLKTFVEVPSLQFLFEEPTVAGVAKSIDALRFITSQNHSPSEEADLESIDF